ncbi:MAG: phosphoserine phosphatase SerB [Eikenella sp.]|nr:phosphoserine phosphatase SerB [Eikenella sp.]
MTHVLVIQHPRPDTLDLSALPAGLPAPARHRHTTLRFAVAADFRLPESAVQALYAQEADVGVLPDRAFADLGLVVSDMDATLITIECVDEIAAAAGLKAQVAAITEQSMRGEIDFEQSLRRRVALLAGLPESALQQVYDEVLQLTPGTETLLAECRAHGVKFMLVSGGFTFFTERLRARLGFEYAFANQLAWQNGQLSGGLSGRLIDAQTKADLLAEYRDRLGLRREQTLAVGDGANDIPMLQAAGLGVAFRAKPKTEAAAGLCIRFGGLEAVRGWFR